MTFQEKTKSASGKKGDKRSESPGKRSKSPKKKTKKGEAERPPSPKKDTKLKRRGEVEDTFKTIGQYLVDCFILHSYLHAIIMITIINITTAM